MDEAEGLSEADVALVERTLGRRVRAEFNDMLPRDWQNRDLAKLLTAARAESRSTPDREGVARIVDQASGDFTQGESSAVNWLPALARPASSAGGGLEENVGSRDRAELAFNDFFYVDENTGEWRLYSDREPRELFDAIYAAISKGADRG